MESERVQQLLDAWRAGDREALMQLTPIVYRQLHHLASFYMRRERQGHTLQATALVHEAFTRLVTTEVSINDTKHFFTLAARIMRNVLVDRSKAKGRVKRTGQADEGGQDIASSFTANEVDLIGLDAALKKLEKADPDVALTIELVYFGGLTVPETAKTIGHSATTVERALRFGKAWLLKHIDDRGE